MDINRQLVDWQQPEDVAEELIKTWGEAGFIWLDGDGSNLGRWVTLATDPIEEICCRGLPHEPKSSNPFEALRTLHKGHWTGWLSYEAGAWIEPKNPWKANKMSTLWIASHDPILRFDLEKKQLWIEGYNQQRLQMFSTWLTQIKSIVKRKSKPSQGIPINSWKWHTSSTKYLENVCYIKNLIQNGDLFQANLTAGCSTYLPKKIIALELFQRLRQSSPTPFSGIVIGAGSANGEAVISTSPERFLKVLPTGEVETRPIKGTRPRHKDLLTDAAMAADLVTSTKDRAENVMIVDLLRNDLGRVCKPGTINVPQLVGLESYPHVHHLTSVIKGSLETGKNWIDLLESCWPGGSISGAPKLRSCQRLNELEPIARGPYCGSLIKVNWNGEFDSNILIRTLILKDSKLQANAGCGIVADSDPRKEAEELNWKLLPLLKALE